MTEALKKIAEAISEALNCDVTIIDEKGMRVAGTGPYRSQTGKLVPQGSAFSQVLRAKKTVVIETPGKDESCFTCRNKENCIETYEICCPILRTGKALGVIGIFAHDQQQKAFLQSRREAYLNFLDHMAQLIASMEGERILHQDLRRQNQEMEAVIQNVNNGVVCVSEDGIITQINQKAAEFLGQPLPADKLVGVQAETLLSNRFLTEALATGEECVDRIERYESGNRFLELMTTVKRTGSDVKSKGSMVITFSDFEKMEKTAYRHREKSNHISFDTLTGTSPKLTAVKERAKIVAANDSTVMITGESGTGKELFARAIHNGSSRRDDPFVSINCSAIPETLLESELFGYEAGAFTGASKNGKAGKLELANKGTFFLDEIGDMPLYLQAKLLRVVQERSLTRVGGLESIDLDVRIISATNKNLEELIEKKMFREDLYYRLNVIPLQLPALAERKEDIPILLQHFLTVYNDRFGKRTKGFTKDAMEFLMDYPWPGNIRELENLVEYGINFAAGDYIQLDDIRERLKRVGSDKSRSLKKMVERYERCVIEEYLALYGRDEAGRERAAEALGISRATLYRKLSQN